MQQTATMRDGTEAFLARCAGPTWDDRGVLWVPGTVTEKLSLLRNPSAIKHVQCASNDAQLKNGKA